MYREFYNLRSEPFSLSPDPNFLFEAEAHKEALAHLRYGLIQKKGFVLITGEVGTGKTTLINTLLQNLPDKVHTAFISNPKLSKDEFFLILANEFRLGAINNKASFLIRFGEFLEKSNKQDINVVLIVDEAHQIDDEVLEEIRLLSNLETPDAKLINIILVGQPELIKKINKIENRALRQRITLRYSLRPLDFKETVDYVHFRLMKAGSKDIGIFNQSALRAIYKYSHGIPRLINLLADHALLTGFVKEVRTIDDKIIKECANELDLEEVKLKVSGEDEEHADGKSKKTLWPALLLVFSFFLIAAYFFKDQLPIEKIVKFYEKFIASIRW